MHEKTTKHFAGARGGADAWRPGSTPEEESLPHLLPYLLLLILAALWAAPAVAQDSDGEEESPALPEIAPREVEIRGKLDVSLPSLERPALSGLLRATRLEPLPPLAPPPITDPTAPDGAPQALSDDGAAADAPSFTPLPPPARGLLEAGGGRYFSRFARGRLNLPLAQKWALRTRLDYTGADGFEPFEDDDVKTPADRFDGSLTLRTERERLSAALTASGFFQQHTLYGADFGSSSVTAAVNEHPDRDLYGGSAALNLETSGRVPIGGRLSYEAAQVKTAVLESEDPFERREQRLRASAHGEAPLGPTRVEASVRFSTADLGGGFGDVSVFDGGGGLWLLDEAPYRLFAGARVLSFDAGEAGGVYPAPDVRFEWTAAPRLTLYAHTRPAAEANPLAALYRANPSLLSQRPPQQPTLRTLDAEGGLRFFADRFELDAFGGYRYAPNRLFFEKPPDGDRPFDAYQRGTTTARYAEARILRLGGQVSLRRTGGLHASLSATYRDGVLTDANTAIPYFSPLVAEALFSYDFGRGRVQLTGAFESARFLDRSETEEVGAFADLDVEGYYDITSSLGLVVRLENLPAGALERYDRYPRAPVVVGSGLRVRF